MFHLISLVVQELCAWLLNSSGLPLLILTCRREYTNIFIKAFKYSHVSAGSYLLPFAFLQIAQLFLQVLSIPPLHIYLACW